MKMKGNATSLLIAGTVILASQNDIQAATLWTGATDLNYGTAGNWDTGSPGNNEQLATINNGDTVSLASDYTGTNTYNLVVGGNSTLNASAAFTATGLTIENTGTVNLTGGAFTLPQTSGNNNGEGAAGVLNIQSGGTLNISGGSHIFNERSIINGTFQVDGSESTISMNQIGALSGTFDFIFDSGGVSSITGDLSFSWLQIGDTTVTVDGSAFSGTGSFTLFDSESNGVMPTADKYTISGFGGEGVGWTLDITNNDPGVGRDTVILNIIPEPSSAGLLGIALAGLLLRRRRA